jgi:hypothetical protein
MARRKKQNEDQPNENPENINSESDDTFGLPEIEYEPLKREESETKEPSEQESSYTREEERAPEPLSEAEHVEEETVDEHPEYRSTYYEEEKPAVWPKVLGIALVLLLAAGVVWFFASYRPEQQRKLEEARRAEAARVEAARKREEERQADLRRQEAEQRRLDSLANAQPKEGVIEALSDRTGRYYVVVASAVDDDLLMDFAQKLSKKGTSSKLIPPFGKHKFYRLAVDVKDSFADAQATADGMKGGDYGDQIWVIRY